MPFVRASIQKKSAQRSSRKKDHRVHARRPAAAGAILYTVEQFAEALGISPVTARHMVRLRQVDVVRLPPTHRHVRIPRSAIDAIIERGFVPAKRAAIA